MLNLQNYLKINKINNNLMTIFLIIFQNIQLIILLGYNKLITKNRQADQSLGSVNETRGYQGDRPLNYFTKHKPINKLTYSFSLISLNFIFKKNNKNKNKNKKNRIFQRLVLMMTHSKNKNKYLFKFFQVTKIIIYFTLLINLPVILNGLIKEEQILNELMKSNINAIGVVIPRTVDNRPRNIAYIHFSEILNVELAVKKFITIPGTMAKVIIARPPWYQ